MEAARRMAREELERKLREIDMGEGEFELYRWVLFVFVF